MTKTIDEVMERCAHLAMTPIVKGMSMAARRKWYEDYRGQNYDRARWYALSEFLRVVSGVEETAVLPPGMADRMRSGVANDQAFREHLCDGMERLIDMDDPSFCETICKQYGPKG